MITNLFEIGQVLFDVGMLAYVIKKATKRKDTPELPALSTRNFISSESLEAAPELGISYEEYFIKETEEEYITRLKNLYPEASVNYNKYNAKIHKEADRHVNKLILNARAGGCSSKLTNYALEFDDEYNTHLWIENRWFGFGHVHRCDIKTVMYELENHTISFYTYMILVDYYHEKLNEHQWRFEHHEYTRKKLRVL